MNRGKDKNVDENHPIFQRYKERLNHLFGY